MASCFNGRVLHVDLSKGTTRIEERNESFYRTYGGGSAMGLSYVLRETPPGTDALAQENVLTLFCGVPTGLPIAGQARLSANARSPLTGAIGDSQSGGFFPAELKFAGFDGIVIRGRSSRPAYLWLHNGSAELREASHLAGRVTGEVERLLRQELGDDKIRVLQTGPAGEKLVRFASIISMCNRANGRTGMGAVMGAKNLRAIAVRGNGNVTPADREGFARLVRLGRQRFQNSPGLQGLGINGTSGGIAWMNSVGSLPTRNYNEGQFEGYESICGETMTDTILKGRDTCFGCMIRCKRVVETDYNGRAVLPEYGGPEAETLAAFGSYCGVADLKAIALANQLCNQHGLDTISCGATVAFAMECFEHGLISAQDTGGMELRFGNADAMVRLVEMIAAREGLGDVLAEGAVRAAHRIGREALAFLADAKGSDAPAHMPHVKKSLGLVYAVNPFGADHESSDHDGAYESGASAQDLERLALLGLTNPQPAGSMNEEKVRLAYRTQLFYSANDSLGLCNFVWGPSWPMYGPADVVALLRTAVGWEVTMDDVLAIGERRLNMLRAFNAREGIGRDADTLSSKFFRPLQGSGPTAGVSLNADDLERHKDTYYALAGWDVHSGMPTKEKLASLGLDWIDLAER